ncbi:unnamed protein product, partial [Oppiella nova]
WTGSELGPSSQQLYKFKISDNCKCGPDPDCRVSDGLCICPHGILGKYDCHNTCPLDCKHGGTCINTDNGNHKCVCKHGFQGPVCETKIKCKSEQTVTKRGHFVWNEIGFNEKDLQPCPHDSTTSAARSCLLQPNGTTYWSPIDDSRCQEKAQTTTTEQTLSTTSISVLDLKVRDIVHDVVTNTKIAAQALSALDDYISGDSSEVNEITDFKSILELILSETPMNASEVFITSNKNFATKAMNVSDSDANNDIS